MANRISVYAKTVQAKLDKLGGKTLQGGSILDFEKTLDLEPFEHHRYQDMQARAHADGTLTTPEAMTVYRALGESGLWPKRTTLAMKVAVTNLMAELIQRDTPRPSLFYLLASIRSRSCGQRDPRVLGLSLSISPRYRRATLT